MSPRPQTTLAHAHSDQDARTAACSGVPAGGPGVPEYVHAGPRASEEGRASMCAKWLRLWAGSAWGRRLEEDFGTALAVVVYEVGVGKEK